MNGCGRLALLTTALLLLSACRGAQDADEPAVLPLGVLVTVAPQAEMVRAIGGERVSVTELVPAGQSPHLYEPVPSVLRAAAEATLYFTVGSGIEFERSHLETIRQQNAGLTVLPCAEGVALRGLAEPHHHDHGDHDGHDGHAEQGRGSLDPHIWLSPANLRAMAAHVRDGLVAADPDGEATYTAGHLEYVGRIEELDGELKAMLEPHAGRAFLVYHPSWGYFADAYGLRQIAVEEGGRKPGPAGIAAVIDQAREHGIQVVFVAPQFDRTAAETVAAEIGGRVVVADPLAADVPSTLRALGGELAAGYAEAAPPPGDPHDH